MTNKTLAEDYLIRAKIRMKALYTLRDEGGYADVVRESQELVELVLKARLRDIGIEPPHWHDVGPLLLENLNRLSTPYQASIQKIIELSSKLRKERELIFYGDDDYLPTNSYTLNEANGFIAQCEWLIQL